MGPLVHKLREDGAFLLYGPGKSAPNATVPATAGSSATAAAGTKGLRVLRGCYAARPSAAGSAPCGI